MVFWKFLGTGDATYQ